MATLNNVYDRVRRLVEAGRIYYGQPTEKLRAVLQAASEAWWCCQYDDPGAPPRRRWGDGPNEDLETLTWVAQEALYGEPADWEDIQRWESLLPGVWQRAVKLSQARPSGSPYHLAATVLAEFLVQASIEGLDGEALLQTNDSKHWRVVEWWQAGYTVRQAMDLDWAARFAHHTGCRRYQNLVSAQVWGDDPRRHEAMRAMFARVRPHRYRQALVGWLLTGDADAAVAFANQSMTLREACEQAKAAAALLECVA